MATTVRFGEFLYLYNQVVRQMLRGVLWLPLLIQGGLAIGLAIVHNSIFSPVFGPVMKTWVGFLYPAAVGAFFHYPEHFLMLPMIFGSSSRVLNLVCEAFFFGIFSDMLICLYRGEKPAFMRSLKKAGHQYLKLTISWAILIGLLYLVSTYFYGFLENVLGFSLHTAPRRQFFAFVMLHGLTVLFYVPFVFIIPSIVLGNGGWGAQLVRGFKMAFQHPFVAFGIIAIPYTIAAIPAIPLSYTEKIIEVFNPELVYQILLVAIGVNIIANFILMGTSVKFFMDKVEE